MKLTGTKNEHFGAPELEESGERQFRLQRAGVTQPVVKREKSDKQKRRCQWHSRRDAGSLTGSIKSDEKRTRPPELAMESRMIPSHDRHGDAQAAGGTRHC